MTEFDKIDLDAVVTKSQHPLYEYHFVQADPNAHGIVSSIEANNYFQRSNLKADQLKTIWNLSDPHGRGYLDRHGFYVALKLIALAQNNFETIDYSNINKEIVPPNIAGDIPQSVTLAVPDMWMIGPSARYAFDRAFDKLSGSMNKLPGTTVKPIFLKSGLPADQLHKIWELSDIDEDGALDRHEFAISMFLIQGIKTSTIRDLPDRLPINLMPIRMRRVSGFGTDLSVSIPNVLPTAVSGPLPGSYPSQLSPSKRADDHWVVSNDEKLKFDALFQKIDLDKDGFISGGDVYQTFLASGLPSFVLSHIWNLCDIGQTGKLNNEQFALASYFISLKLQAPNYQLPMELSHEMIPPSLRPKTFSVNESDNAELQQLLSEVNALNSEKNLCEVHFNEKQQAVKDKRAELAALELRSGTANATLAERQQRMAEKQKEYNDIQNRKEKTLKDLQELEQQIKDEQRSIDQARERLKGLSVESNAQQEARQKLSRLKDEKTTQEDRLNLKQQQLTQSKLELERYQFIAESQKALIDEYLRSEQKNSQAAIDELKMKFQQVNQTPLKNVTNLSTKLTSPTQSTNNSSDPFGVSTQNQSTANNFFDGRDPFGMPKAEDPFFSSAKPTTSGNQTMDNSDPFRASDFSAAQELVKKTLANRSKTPGANMFGGHDFAPFANQPTNRPQSATPWEPTRQNSTQPASQVLNDLFDVFG